jgi:uncharacterized repeat protein (TIGR01451 family)
MKKSKTSFKRLVSNLPYNPSLITQVSFYAKRLRQETSIRRLGFLFFALTFFVQMFAVIAPPKLSSAQDTDNDVIRGGFSSHAQANADCDNNVQDYAGVLDYFGISCNDVHNAQEVTIRSTDSDGRLMSMGRKPYFANEINYTINGNPYHLRPLQAWDRGVTSTYRAIEGTTPNGLTFILLYDCGNPVFIGVPPPKPTPKPTPVKSVSCTILLMNHESNDVLKKGDTVTVVGQFSGTNMSSTDTIDMAYDYINADTGQEVVPPVRANGNLFKNGVASDIQNRSFVMNTPGRYTFRLAGVFNGALVPGSFVSPCARTISVAVPVVTCHENPNLPQCKPCPNATPTQPEKCLVFSKMATNETTGDTNANNSTAHAGDVITYNLFTKNTGKVTVKKFVVSESMSDVLDYADITDLHGGTMSADHFVTWKAVDIKAGETLHNQITIKVKSPVPNTPVSTSNPAKFDLIMSNKYGNTVNIKLPTTTIKTTETVTTALPNTGPGENIAVGFIVFAFVGYFFARSRLMTKELDLVRQEYTTGA